MRAYVTSIGERTTDICVSQLKKFGYEVLLLNQVEPWFDKYKKFISIADENCLRVDADIIVNQNIMNAERFTFHFDNEWMMVQFSVYDLYKNLPHSGVPVMYNKKALEIIRNNFYSLDPRRPEATAWRLPQINRMTYTIHELVGMHGFFQDKESILRHMKNKIERKQIDLYDFDLAEKLMNL